MWCSRERDARGVAAVIDRDAIMAEVRDRVTAWLRDHGDDTMALSAMCLYHAAFAVEALKARGHHAFLQAGSAQWRMVAPELDDGVSPTHLGYMFDLPSATSALQRGMMPEMHVWAGLEPRTLIDLTTGYQPVQARRLLNKEWTAPLPPPFVWGLPPDSCRYKPSRHAVRIAVMLAADVIGIERATALVS